MVFMPFPLIMDHTLTAYQSAINQPISTDISTIAAYIGGRLLKE